MPSAPDRNKTYVARHHVRAFLAEYAPPSALEDIINALPDESPWRTLVQAVYCDLMGSPTGPTPPAGPATHLQMNSGTEGRPARM